MGDRSTAEPEAIELTTGHVVPGGRCLARHEGKVLLVAGALPGETVRVRPTRSAKQHDEAEVVEVVKPHPARREPPCPHAADCGGCDLQHAPRELQLEMKRSIVVDAFRRVGRLDVEPLLAGPRATGDEFGSRNRIALTYDAAGKPGLMKRSSHDVVAIDDCMLMPRVFGETLLPWLRELPAWRRASVRLDSSGAAVAVFESPRPSREADRRRRGKLTRQAERPTIVKGLLAGRARLDGERELVFRVAGKELTADAESFFQVNPAGTEELVETVRTFLGEERAGSLLDLYAGVGLFSVCCGEGFHRVVASDTDHRAVRHLQRNLRRARLRGAARCEQAERTLSRVPRADRETVIVDPPRAGLSKTVRRELIERQPLRIVSVSCDPATAARDVATLVEAGWRLERLRAVDLFPVTAHVETVALLVR